MPDNIDMLQFIGVVIAFGIAMLLYLERDASTKAKRWVIFVAFLFGTPGVIRMLSLMYGSLF